MTEYGAEPSFDDLRSQLSAERPAVDWEPVEPGTILLGTVVRIEAEDREDSDGQRFTSEAIVLTEVGTDEAFRVKIGGQLMKRWRKANPGVGPGSRLAIRYDGRRSSDNGLFSWDECTVKPDVRDQANGNAWPPDDPEQQPIGVGQLGDAGAPF